MAKKLHYSVEDLQKQSAAIADISTGLQGANDALQKGLKDLKSDWVSTASKRFFENYDDDWLGQISGYCKLLDDFASALTYASEQYGPLQDDYNRIRLDV